MVNFEDRISKLRDERNRLIREGHHRGLKGEPDGRYVETVSNDISALSTKMSKLESQLDMQLDALIDDLDVILGSKVLQPWIASRVPLLNRIWEKLERLNHLEVGHDYRNKRILATKTKPARYWLNENFDESGRKYRRLTSIATPDYALIGIKGNWNKRVGGKLVPVSKRDTLRKALDFEEKHDAIVIPRTVEDALPLKAIDALKVIGYNAMREKLPTGKKKD